MRALGSFAIGWIAGTSVFGFDALDFGAVGAVDCGTGLEKVGTAERIVAASGNSSGGVWITGRVAFQDERITRVGCVWDCRDDGGEGKGQDGKRDLHTLTGNSNVWLAYPVRHFDPLNAVRVAWA